jgi:excisionase family DNA binding protein
MDVSQNQVATVDRWEVERLLGLGEAAHMLGVSIHTVRMWIQKGDIASNKLGGRRLISTREIERLIEESRRPATRATTFA